MTLLLPLALFGLLTLPAILLLHLLRNRREQLPIPSLRLWRGLQQRRHGRLPRHIPLSLLLLLQLIVATALTLSLAQPVWSFVLDQPRQVIFILDLTTSMTATDVPSASTSQAARRFDVARQAIASHLQGMRPSDTFAIVSLDARPQILLTGGIEQQTPALVALDNLVPGATGSNLISALTLANGLVDPDRENQIVVLTDGNLPIVPEALPPVKAPLDWQLIGDQPGPGNQALLDVSARALPDGRPRLFARVVNFSDSPVRRTIRVLADGVIFSEAMVDLPAQGDAVRVWTLPATVETAAVELVEPDGLPLDNQAELLLFDTAAHRVLLAAEQHETLARALEVQPGVELTVGPANPTDYDSTAFDLLVFNGLPVELTTWPAGNVLVINPPLGHPLLPARAMARNLRADPATAGALLTGIDLSGVYFGRATRLTAPDWATLDLASAATEREEPLPLIFHGTVGDSRVMVWAFDLGASNLPARLALPLLAANTLSTLLAPSPPAVVALGEPVLLTGNFSVELPDGHRLYLDPSQTPGSGYVFSRTKQPGLYRIFSENNKQVAGFAVQAGSPLESNLAQPQPDLEQLNRLAVSPLPAPAPDTALQEYWPWLAGLALLVVTVEGVLVWRR